MHRSTYHRGTFIDPEEYAYPSGALGQSRRRARALCSDGQIRLCVIGIPDTYFSIPARVKVRGKTVTGYISVATISGFDTATDDDPAIVKFRANAYGKNASLLP